VGDRASLKDSKPWVSKNEKLLFEFKLKMKIKQLHKSFKGMNNKKGLKLKASFFVILFKTKLLNKIVKFTSVANFTLSSL
jgi:hypothetical protein